MDKAMGDAVLSADEHGIARIEENHRHSLSILRAHRDTLLLVLLGLEERVRTLEARLGVVVPPDQRLDLVVEARVVEAANNGAPIALSSVRGCEWCGTEFTPENARHTYCSVACQHSHALHRKRLSLKA